MVKRVFGMVIGIAVLGLGSAFANTVALPDWCFNQNGDISASCNGAGAAPAGFDATFSPNNLGTATFTLNPGEYVAVWLDYDVNFATDGSFQDQGSVVGSLPAGWSYELDDPSTNIFSDFASNALTNMNNVAVGSGAPNVCCDVSWALAISGVAAPTPVKFLISDVAPATGFYLQQNNINTGEAIYLSATVGSMNGTVPEPSTLLLVAVGGGLLAWRRRRKAIV